MEKELKYAKLVASSDKKREYDMFLIGEIGMSGECSINGHEFARELNWLLRNEVDVTIKINSIGGSTAHMRSIISEMAMSKYPITTINVGVAYSSAAIVLLMGDKREAVEGSETMIHSARYVDENGETIKDEDLDEVSLKHLKHTNSTFASLIKSKMSVSDEDAVEILSKDTLFIGEEQLKAGIITKIIPLDKKIDRSLFAELSPKMRMVACASYYNNVNSNNNNNNKTGNKMDENVKVIAVAIGLPEDSNPASVIKSFTSLRAEKEKAEAQVKELQAKLDEIDSNLIVAQVDEKIDGGFIAKESRDSVVAILRKSTKEEAKLFLNSLKAVVTPIKHSGVDLGNPDENAFKILTDEQANDLQASDKKAYRKYLSEYNAYLSKKGEK